MTYDLPDLWGECASGILDIRPTVEPGTIRQHGRTVATFFQQSYVIDKRTTPAFHAL